MLTISVLRNGSLIHTEINVSLKKRRKISVFQTNVCMYFSLRATKRTYNSFSFVEIYQCIKVQKRYLCADVNAPLFALHCQASKRKPPVQSQANKRKPVHPSMQSGEDLYVGHFITFCPNIHEIGLNSKQHKYFLETKYCDGQKGGKY